MGCSGSARAGHALEVGELGDEAEVAAFGHEDVEGLEVIVHDRRRLRVQEGQPGHAVRGQPQPPPGCAAWVSAPRSCWVLRCRLRSPSEQNSRTSAIAGGSTHTPTIPTTFWCRPTHSSTCPAAVRAPGRAPRSQGSPPAVGAMQGRMQARICCARWRSAVGGGGGAGGGAGGRQTILAATGVFFHWRRPARCRPGRGPCAGRSRGRRSSAAARTRSRPAGPADQTARPCGGGGEAALHAAGRASMLSMVSAKAIAGSSFSESRPTSGPSSRCEPGTCRPGARRAGGAEGGRLAAPYQALRGRLASLQPAPPPPHPTPRQPRASGPAG